MPARPGLSHASPLRPARNAAVPGFEPQGVIAWRGASGTVYPHTVFTLIGCPAPQGGTYLLVARGPRGERHVLAVRAARSAVPSVNLAALRLEGARLGADEVHLADLATVPRVSEIAAFDLAAAHDMIRPGLSARAH